MTMYVCTYTIDAIRLCFFTDSLRDARQQMQRHVSPGRIFRLGGELEVGGFGREDNQRVYLDCPFEEKDEAKALGAMWDNDRRKWYVPFTHPLDRFQRWLPNRFDAQVEQKSVLARVQHDDWEQDGDVIDFSDEVFLKEQV